MSSKSRDQTTIQESTNTPSPTEKIVREAEIGDQIRLLGLSDSTALDETDITAEIARTHGTNGQDHLVLETPRGPLHICTAGSRTRVFGVTDGGSGHDLRPLDNQRIPTMRLIKS